MQRYVRQKETDLRRRCARRTGLIVAIKGLDGCHLACDATSSDRRAGLRERNRWASSSRSWAASLLKRNASRTARRGTHVARFYRTPRSSW